ncbi:unnamed protein product [Arctogadus glacialis]
MGNILPLNIVRLTNRDTPLGKYTIPKGTVVMATLNSVLHDETVWETPHSFNPQHFLDQDGQARKREAFLPFSAGKRVCPGEQLARMELYIFLSSLLQRFSFSAPPWRKAQSGPGVCDHSLSTALPPMCHTTLNTLSQAFPKCSPIRPSVIHIGYNKWLMAN